ncbi:MAG: nucleoside triphosphate pyrophosphohydrolase [Patescibacteria group bacterium]
MKKMIYHKLVRDRIPEIITADGGVPEVRVLDEGAFKAALRDKMVEEAGELANAKTREEILNELADILQLVESVAQVEDVTIAEVESKKQNKKVERGGFDQRWFLERVEKFE